MAFFTNTIGLQRLLIRFCRVLCITIVSLALFLAYVYPGQLSATLTFNIKDKTQTDSMDYNIKRQAIMACSDNMFITPEGCLQCPDGTFTFSGWTKCEPLLNCSEIAFQIQNRQEIQGGNTKEVWLAEWKGHKVVYLKCKRQGVKRRCLRGMTTMEKLQSPFVTRLIGKCYEKLEYSRRFRFLTLNSVSTGECFAAWRNGDTSKDTSCSNLVRMVFPRRKRGRSFFLSNIGDEVGVSVNISATTEISVPGCQIVTMHYKHGSAKSLDQLLRQPEFSQYNNIQTRFQLSLDYVKIINFMHNSPIGILVMCDSASLDQLLSQYLITDDFHMVVNDLDITPDASQENGILCHHKKELRTFVAPEQRWPNGSVPFRLNLMPTYDEKVDIWKIPAVLERLLGEVNGSSFVKSNLRKMMESCHVSNPKQRPTANEVLQELLRMQQLIEH